MNETTAPNFGSLHLSPVRLLRCKPPPSPNLTHILRGRLELFPHSATARLRLWRASEVSRGSPGRSHPAPNSWSLAPREPRGSSGGLREAVKARTCPWGARPRTVRGGGCKAKGKTEQLFQTEQITKALPLRTKRSHTRSV